MSKLVVGVVALALIGVGVWYYAGERSAPAPSTNTPTTTPQAQVMTYASTTQSLRFSYPNTYELEQREQGAGAARHQVITLMRKADLPPPQNGEGPISITVQIFPVSAQNLSAWIRSTQESNFALSPDDQLTTTTVAGTEGLRYRWSGLYEGESVAVLRGGRVYIFSHTWLNDDTLRADFERLLESVEFAWG